MIIGLMGFEFESANKGCEALVYSFLSVLQQYLKDDTIIYNFTGTELGIIPSKYERFTFINIKPKIRDFKARFIRAIHKCDFIFDVTMGDSFSDIYSKDFYNSLIRHKRIAELFGRKYVLLPQTYGPFEFDDSYKKAQKVLKNAYKIYCRDELSQQLLADEFNINNSVLSTDMAFILPYNTDLYSFSGNYKIGINISGLLYKGGFHKENQFNLSVNYPALIKRILDELSERFEVHLIPHVIDLSDNAYDDDYKICKMLHDKYPKTILSPAFETPIEAKSYICNMDVFIGSRMHSTIASFSSGVITIPLSYSRKFEGLYDSLQYPFVVNGRVETTESAYELIMQYVNNPKLLSKAQQLALVAIEDKIECFKQSIYDIFNEDK